MDAERDPQLRDIDAQRGMLELVLPQNVLVRVVRSSIIPRGRNDTCKHLNICGGGLGQTVDRVKA
jgi:hypothetical protein